MTSNKGTSKTLTVIYYKKMRGLLVLEKMTEKLKLRLKKITSKKFFRNYEKLRHITGYNQLCASMLGRHIFGYNWLLRQCVPGT